VAESTVGTPESKKTDKLLSMRVRGLEKVPASVRDVGEPALTL